MLVLITVVIFITILTVLLTIMRYAGKPQGVTKARVNNYIERPLTSVQDAVAPEQLKGMPGWRSFVRRMSHHFEWSGQSRSLERKLIQAGVPLRGAEFVVVCVGMMLVCGLVLFMFSGGKMITACIGFVIGLVIPLYVLRAKAAKRVKQFNDQLGDALGLVANSLRTGYGFMQALDMVSREMPAPIAPEFGRVLKEMNLGLSTEDAMSNLTTRVNSDDLNLVITAVLIQRQVGGNLAEVLDNIANTIRERVKLKGEVQTLTAQGRISGMIIGGLPFALGVFIYVINPGYMQVLFTNPMGKIVLGVAFVSQVFGMLIIRKIVDIKY